MPIELKMVTEVPRPSSGVRWLTSTVLGIGAASLFSDLSHETITAVLPSFIAGMGAAAAALGTIEGVADGFSTAAKLYGGWMADRVGNRKILAASGYSVMALSPLIIAAAITWPIVLAGRTLAWISRGLRTPARKALLADGVAPEAYGRAFGLERAMDTTGAIIAPLAVLGLLHFGWSTRHIILLSTIPAMLAAVAILVLVREVPNRVPHPRPFLQSLGGFGPRFNEFLAAVGLFGLGDFADTLYILYTVAVLTPQIGAARATTISVAFYAVHNVLYAFWSYAGGWIADRVNKRLLLVCGYTSAAVAAALILCGVTSYVGLAFMFALGGMGVGLYEAVEDALAAELLPAPIRGSGFGMLSVVTGMGDLFSSLVVGWLWAAFSIQVAFVFALVLMLLGVVLMTHLAFKRNHGA